MSKEITLKIDQIILDKIKAITKIKFPLRNITNYAEATREALIDYVRKNQKFLNNENQQNNTIKTETEA